MINPHFPSLAFVASFLAAFGRLDPFDPRLMYLWVPFSIFGRFQLPRDTRKDAGQIPVRPIQQTLQSARQRFSSCIATTRVDLWYPASTRVVATSGDLIGRWIPWPDEREVIRRRHNALFWRLTALVLAGAMLGASFSGTSGRSPGEARRWSGTVSAKKRQSRTKFAARNGIR
jgi:hypothetical protein